MNENMTRTLSYGVSGVKGFPVQVEVFSTGGIPGMEIIGLPDASVRESKDRVNAAIISSGKQMPPRRITVNLAPADMKKSGPLFDLPIAIGILSANGELHPAPVVDLTRTVIFGELSLDGYIQPVNGALPIVISASEAGLQDVILPAGNAREVSCIQGMHIYPVNHLREVIEHIEGKKTVQLQHQTEYEELKLQTVKKADLLQVKGQLGARRALEVAAAGGHNMLMIGSPGSGKTMLARCLPGILPPLSFEESLETTRIHSIAGKLPPGSGLMTQRPFCAPHHSASVASLIGGGQNARPGEVSLAHNGVLFLDELPEFSRNALESLRQPLEDGTVSVTRVKNQAQYQSSFMLIAGMNPCPCGYYGSRQRQCRCTRQEIRRYLDRVSGPLLDRIDIQIEVPRLKTDDLINKNFESESSESIRKRVTKAREIQSKRYQAYGIHTNSELTPKLIKKFCKLDEPCEHLIKTAGKKFNISGRGFDRLLKLARTIADLDGEENISLSHLSQALQYRNFIENEKN